MPIGDDIVCTYSVYTSPQTSPSAVLPEIAAEAVRLTQDYVWFNESFSLRVSDNSLIGRTNCGCCLDDEWNIARVLLSCSKSLEIIIQLSDQDGQFLLIEAAEQLPDWVDVDIMDNRVFIQSGQVQLLPESAPSWWSEDDDWPDEMDCNTSVSLLHRFPGAFAASTAIQHCIESRISSLVTGDLSSARHHTTVLLPPVLSLLFHRPLFIPQLVRAYCYKQVSQTSSCTISANDLAAVSNFLSGCDSLQHVRLRFTRHLYALLNFTECDLSSLFTEAGCSYAKQTDKKAAKSGAILTCGLLRLIKHVAQNTADTQGALDSDVCRALEKRGLESDDNEIVIRTRLVLGHSVLFASLISDCCRYIADPTSVSTVLPNKLSDDDEAWLQGNPGHSESASQAFEAYAEEITNKVVKFLEQEVELDGLENKRTDHMANNLDLDGDTFGDSIRKLVDACNSSTVHDDSSEMDSYNEDASIGDEDLDKFDGIATSMRDYMTAMDHELVSEHPNAARSKSPPRGLQKSPGADSIDLVDDEFSAVSIDKQAVSGLLAQKSGATQPATGLLFGMRATMDSDDDLDEDSIM